jgi:hypothetical protein
MLDYESEFVYMIPLPYLETITYYEDIIIAPARIRGAIIGNEKKKKKIEFKVIDASGETILEHVGKEYIFDFTTTSLGKYTFEFKNLKVT